MHALLSASSAHRWIMCTPSARLEEQFPDNHSESAAEGTLAHELGELKIGLFNGNITKKEYNKKYKAIKENSLFSKDMDSDTDKYLDYVKEIVHSYGYMPLLEIEKKIKFDDYVPEGFGTADCIIVYLDEMHIIDFKYGKRNYVEADDNVQMKLYALGALKVYGCIMNTKRVNLHIFQPRMDNTKCFALSSEDLYSWGESIKGIANRAFKGEGEEVVGDHCKFCRAKAICRARANQNLELAKFEFRKPPLLSHEDVGSILQKALDLATWASDLKDWALTEIIKGAQIPGWKAVAGRSTRAFIDQEKAFSVLVDSGIDENMLYERKPLSLTGLESMLGKKEFSSLLNEYIVKSEGKPTIVLENDVRQSIVKSSAQDDFK